MYSRQEHLSDGSLVTLDMAIGYIRRGDITVLFDGIRTSDWAWIPGQDAIRFNSPVPAGVLVTVQRATQRDRVINVFDKGASFTNRAMDTDFAQMLYLSQEYLEGTGISDLWGDLDMHGFQIRNLGRGTAPGDAVNVAQLAEVASDSAANLRTDLAAPGGSAIVGHDPRFSGSVPTTVEKLLNGRLDVTMFGAHPSFSSAVNTAAINTANLEAVRLRRPLYFPPIGVFKIRRLAPVTGVLTWYSENLAAVVQVDGDNWPYDLSPAPILEVTGSFYTHNMTWDQNWITPKHPNVGGPYRDDANPSTWGGNWFVLVRCSTADSLSVAECHLQTIARGFFAQAADTAIGGAASVSMTDCTGDSKNTAAQTVLAADASQTFRMTGNNLVTKQWNRGATYESNGTSVCMPYGGTDIQILDNRFIGYQVVCRGPSSNVWTPNTYYPVGWEYVAQGGESYRVVSSYTSGSAFGANDLEHTVLIYNPQQRIQVCRNFIISPIADTAIYGWQETIINENNIVDSGDMGIATSGSGYMSVCNNIINSTRNGGIDVTYGGIANIMGNVIKDYARASGGVYQRIDTLNPSVWASNGGFNLAGITVGLTQEPGTKQINITGNHLYMSELPPEFDGGPNNGGVVRAAVNGIYSQNSSNVNAQNTINVTGNMVQDAKSNMPRFYIAVPTLRFYNSAATGDLKVGELYSDGAVQFILVDFMAIGGLVFVKQFRGAQGPYGGQVFTSQSGATLTVAATPQLAYLGSVESSNFDYTTKYISENYDTVRRGQTSVTLPTIAVGAVYAFQIPVQGAQIGDFASVACSAQVQGLEITSYVPGAGQVQVIARNGQSAPITIGTANWRARVEQG